MAVGLSVLFLEPPEPSSDGASGHESVFRDLNLDQVVASVCHGREQYDLAGYFGIRLRAADAVRFRHEVFRDLEDPPVRAGVERFAERMRSMRGHLAWAKKMHYPRQAQRWFLDAAQTYCAAVTELTTDLTGAAPRSRALTAMCGYLAEYIDGSSFQRLQADTSARRAELARLRYCMNLRGSEVTVTRYQSEVDYTLDVERSFEKFWQGEAKSHLFQFASVTEMNHVEAGVLDRVAKLFPEVFAAVDAWCARYRDYLDRTIATFDREMQFYLAFLEHLEPMRVAGLRFCYPDVTTSKEVAATQTFDLALANKLVHGRGTMVCNDFALHDPERIIVVSGPNQGGKTTFARTFGQLHHLASLGLPVPGDEARLFLFDRLFTQFEQEERPADAEGNLLDDLQRVHDILQAATSNSVVVLNEVFASTTLEDALSLGAAVMQHVSDLDVLCVWVTFMDELASYNERVASMASTVDPAEPAERTYKIVRKPADGLAYAMAIAKKYALTFDQVRDRLAS